MAGPPTRHTGLGEGLDPAGMGPEQSSGFPIVIEEGQRALVVEAVESCDPYRPEIRAGRPFGDIHFP
jgi:hypothetical protein